MQYSEDQAQIRKWAPLMIEGRDPAQKVAATYMPLGTDVNYGAVTNQLMAGLRKNPNFTLSLQHEVRALRQNADKTWNVTVAQLAEGGKEKTDQGPLRLRGRRRCGPQAAAGIGHSRVEELRGLPRGRAVPRHREPRTHRAP